MSEELKFDLPPRPAERPTGRWAASVAALLIGGLLGYAVGPLRQCGSAQVGATAAAGGALLAPAQWSALAETLERNQVYGEAAQAWQRAAESAPPENAEKKAELFFLIGKNLSLAGEYQRAMTWLFAAEAADEAGRWKSSLNRLVLENLSALGLEEARADQARKRTSLEQEKDDTQVLAEIGGEPITEGHLQTYTRRMIVERLAAQRPFMSAEQFNKAVDAQLEQLKTPEVRQQLLQMYISQEVLYREALAAALGDRKEVRQRMADVRRQMLTAAFIDDYLDRNLKIGETDLENAYQAHQADYVEPPAVKVEALIVDDEKAREEVSKALAGGAGFAELKKKFSKPKSGDAAADVFDRWITRDDRVPLVTDSKAALAHLWTLNKGEVSKKWFTGEGGKYLRFRLADRREPRQLTLAECRQRVERDLRVSKQKDLQEQLQQVLQGKYQVVLREQPKPATQPQAGK